MILEDATSEIFLLDSGKMVMQNIPMLPNPNRQHDGIYDAVPLRGLTSILRVIPDAPCEVVFIVPCLML